jgi:hypothetical protein
MGRGYSTYRLSSHAKYLLAAVASLVVATLVISGVLANLIGPEHVSYRYVSWLGTFITCISLLAAVSIMRVQDRSQRLLEEKLLGNIHGFDTFVSGAAKLLADVSTDKDSRVFAQLYWGWLGADRAVQKTALRPLAQKDSDVGLWLKHRFEGGYPTKLRLLDFDAKEGVGSQRDRFGAFLRAALTYTGRDHLSANLPVSEEIVASTREAYTVWVHELERASAQSDESCVVNFLPTIPILVLVVESERRPSAGLLLLLEQELIENNTASGGFRTEDPDMIDILKRSIATSGRSTGSAVLHPR